MYCTKCGKQINDDAVICVNCGLPTRKFNQVAQPNYAFDERKTNALGVAGFIVSLLSLWFGVLFCISSIVGITLSAVGLAKANKYKPSGLATAGLIFGIISFVLWSIFWIAMIATM